MAFKIPVVSECPYSRRSSGVVRMTPELISALAAAVSDQDEWAIVCKGERTERGYLLNITSYWLPDQDRSGGHVSVKEFEREIDDILVIHSHHSMGAFFSTTDTGQLNPRFPASIVVAQAKSSYLGFDYKGVGKVTLPCGAQAEVEMFIQPTVGPVLHEVKEVTHNPADFGGCVKYEDKATDEYHVHFVAACGLEEAVALKANAFGSEKSMLDVVAKLPRQNGSFNIKDDSDSKWCNEHKTWDFCNMKDRLVCPDCGYVFFSDKIIPGKTLNCQTCKKNVVPVKGGDRKPETLFRSPKKKSAKKGEPLEDLIECLECSAWDTFGGWYCSVCFSPFCQTCGCGHWEGECPDEICEQCQGSQQDCECYCENCLSSLANCICVEELKSRGEEQADGCVVIL